MKINRRHLIKSGLLSLGGIRLASHFHSGAIETLPPDRSGRIYHSPLVREAFQDTEDFSRDMIRLGANENPYGPPASARKAISENVAGGNRYLWSEISMLTDKLAAKEGVPRDHILVGPGSSDLLEKTALTFFRNGGQLISADPTFMSLIRVAEAVGASWKAVPCKPDWSHDLDTMEKAVGKDTRLVYICNPNNPTGSLTSHESLSAFCSRISEKAPVFIDEAYLEFTDGTVPSMTTLLKQGRNVIIARTFSKIMGMAGLRVGYIMALPSTLAQIQKISKVGMGLSNTSVAAAIAALGDLDFQHHCKTQNSLVKEYLCGKLESMGYAYIPSHTNFVIFPIRIPGKIFLEKMTAEGISIRVFEIRDSPWCRVSMGTMDEIKRFVSVLKHIT